MDNINYDREIIRWYGKDIDSNNIDESEGESDGE